MITNTFRFPRAIRVDIVLPMKDPVIVLPAVATIVGLLIFAFLALEVVFHLG